MKAVLTHSVIARFLVLFAILAVGACTTLSLPTVDTFNKRALVGYAAVNYVATTAQGLRAAGKLSDADRANVVTANAAGISALDLAVSMHALACPPPAAASAPPVACTDAGSDAKLTAAVAIVQALQAYLVAQGGATP